MIIKGVDIPRDDLWISQGLIQQAVAEIPSLINSEVSKPVRTFREASAASVDTLPIYLTINPPLLNSQIKSPTPNKAPNPLRPTTSRSYSTTTNPMAFFGTSVLGIGFGVSLIPQITDAAKELGLIEDRDSFEYELEHTV